MHATREHPYLALIVLLAVLGLVVLLWNSSDRSLPESPEQTSSGNRSVQPELMGMPLGVANSRELGTPPDAAIAERVTNEAGDDEERVEIEVVEAVSGLAIEGASVFIAPESWACVKTDVDGVANLMASLAERAVGVVAEGLMPVDLVVGAGEDKVVVEMHEGESVSGIVLDDMGKPVKGVLVWCSQSQNSAAWPHPTKFFAAGVKGGRTVTGDNGRFVVSGLQPGVDYEIAWSKHTWTRSMKRPYPVKAGEGPDVRLTMQPVARVLIEFWDRRDNRRVMLQTLMTTCGPGVNVGGWQFPWEHERQPVNFMGESGGAEHYFVREGATHSDPANSMIGTASVIGEALGYKKVEEDVSFTFGQRQVVRVFLDRENACEFGEVEFSVLVAGRPFTGRLFVYFESESRSSRSSTPFGCNFHDGKQSEPIRMPVGRYTLYAKPLGIMGSILVKTNLGKFDVVRGRVSKKELIIPVYSATVEVLDRAGRRVAGYELGVSVNGKVIANAAENWDLRVRASSNPGTTREGLPVLQLPATGEVVFSVNKFGVGSYKGSLVRGTNPNQGSIVVVLNEPARDNRLAWRQR